MPAISISNRSSSSVTSISGSINASVDIDGSSSGGAVTIVTPIGESSGTQNLFLPGGTQSEVGFSASVSVDNISIISDNLLDLPTIDLNLDQAVEPTPEPEPTDTNLDVILPPSDESLTVDVAIENETSTTSTPATSDSISAEVNVTSPGDSEGTTTVEVSTDGTTTATTLPGSAFSIGVVGGADDYLIGTDASDLLFGSEGNDTVESSLGDDTVWGGKGDDQLMGEAGNDVLIGDLGNDTLTGGPGADTFVLRTSTAIDPNWGDVITDFNPDEGDQIVVIGDILLENLTFEVIDFDGEGTLDASLIRLDETLNNGVLGIVLGSVDEAGQTTLGIDSLTWVSES